MGTGSIAAEGVTGRERRRLRVRRVGTGLIALGILVVIYAGVILFWGDPFTALYADWRQQGLSHTLNQEIAAWPKPAIPISGPNPRPAELRLLRQDAAKFKSTLNGGTAVRPPHHRPDRAQGGGGAGHRLAA